LNTCLPEVKPLYAFGDVHVSHAPLSNWHSKVQAFSLQVNLNIAKVLELDAGGEDVILVSGGVVSRAHIPQPMLVNKTIDTTKKRPFMCSFFIIHLLKV